MRLWTDLLLLLCVLTLGRVCFRFRPGANRSCMIRLYGGRLDLNCVGIRSVADSEFQKAFDELREVLTKYASKMVVVHDSPGNYYLDTKVIPPNKKPMFFGAVQIRKRYVSFHLMPVYVFVELLADVSPELKKRVQGKSCFNFKAVDKALFKELAALVKAGFDRYKKGDLI